MTFDFELVLLLCFRKPPGLLFHDPMWSQNLQSKKLCVFNIQILCLFFQSRSKKSVMCEFLKMFQEERYFTDVKKVCFILEIGHLSVI